jgi:hypothetical protein
MKRVPALYVEGSVKLPELDCRAQDFAVASLEVERTRWLVGDATALTWSFCESATSGELYGTIHLKYVLLE